MLAIPGRVAYSSYLPTLQPIPGSYPQAFSTQCWQCSPSVNGGQTHFPLWGSHICPVLLHGSHSAIQRKNSSIYSLFQCETKNKICSPLQPVSIVP